MEMSYQAKVYRKQGGEELVVASGGKVAVESGGEVDVESGGALKLDGTQITATADEINAITAGAALVGTMVAGTADADHADDTSETEIEVLAANGSGDGDRAILIIVNVTESFAATTNKPIFEIYDGEAVTYATIGHGGSPAAPSADETYTFAGELGEEKALVIDVTDGTGGAEAGAIEVYAIALPADTGA
jgi:hypothetical protein